jgi:hypothetical protein
MYYDVIRQTHRRSVCVSLIMNVAILKLVALAVEVRFACVAGVVFCPHCQVLC